MRAMYRKIAAEMAYTGDDQRSFVRYYLSNPHLSSLDVDSKLFYTGYKMTADEFSIKPNLTVVLGTPYNHMSAGLVHCNNKGSNTLYSR